MDISDLDDHNNFDDLNLDGSDTEEIPLTAGEVIEMMEETWLNEKFAPELLPHKTEIVDCLLGQISHMENNLENHHNSDFQKNIHQLEVDRLRFIITSYLRMRLEKIERYVLRILKQEELRSTRNETLYLTGSETEFARDYKEGLEQHFNCILSFWPNLALGSWENEQTMPNMHTFVFLKSKGEVEGVIIDDGTEEDGDLVDLRNGSQLIISYNSVANLVKNGEVNLI